MDRARIEERGLPMECFRPVLPGSRFIPEDEIKTDADGLPLLPKRLFLLDMRLTIDEIAARCPALEAYLESGKRGEKPVAGRYLCRGRKPWKTGPPRPSSALTWGGAGQ